MIICIFILIWLGSFAKCEVLTKLHGDEFTDGEGYEDLVRENYHLKVLNYSATTARVYYVNPGEGSNIIKFVKKDGTWEFEECERTVWAAEGNADEAMWPYVYDSPNGITKIILYGLPSLIIIIILVCILLKDRKVK
jgi:hypothetical protein